MIATTDGMDSVTAESRNALVGACEPCQHWTPFTRGVDPEECAKCGESFSQKMGMQITTQRSFDATRMKIKAKRKR